MILIADSGSTKTDWAIVTSASQPVVLNTQGINPVHQSREEIVRILREAAQRLNFQLGTVLKTPLAGLVRYHKL
jgi:hypothetical protein